jgi:hypothetical protein
VVIDEDGKFVVVAAVGGRRMRLAIDTGAPVTALFAPRDPDLPEGLTETDRRRVRVQVGEVESDLDVARIQPLRGGGRGYDGLLGMDVLHGCVLALDGEKLVAGCGAPSHEVTPSHLMAMREGVPERDRLRPRMVQWNGRGPALTAHPNGTYTWEGQYVIGEIGRDGHVTIRPRPWWETWDNPIESRDDDRSEERWFRDETQAMRTELWMDEARRLADQSIDGLPSYLAGLWGTGLPAQLRRAELFELWDEAEEPDDPELGVAGAKARAVVDRFIRQNLPRGSRDGFSESELAAFNARRARGPHFTPYDGPRPIPHDTAE